MTDTTSTPSNSNGWQQSMNWSNGSSDPSNSGFNNDSILNVSGNQVPVQTCIGGVQTLTAGALQTLVAGVDVVDPALTPGAITPTNTSTCTQTPSNTNTSALNS
jgi:hypothetical protein